MKKASIAVNGLVEMLLVIVVIVVLFQFLGIWRIFFGSFTEDFKCEGSFIASSMTKVFGNQVLDPDCKTKRITITFDEEGVSNNGAEKKQLDKNHGSTTPDPYDTFTRVKQWNEDPEIPEKSKYTYFDKDQENIKLDTDDENEQNTIRQRYNMDKIIADEMRNCWDNVGNGKLPLFDMWFQFIDCDKSDNDFDKCESAADWFKANPNIAANFCVLCTRVKFDQEVQEKFGSEYDSISLWMANHPYSVAPVPGKELTMSYYEFILSDDQKESLFHSPNFKYTTSEPYAVVFVRTNMHGSGQIVLNAYKFLDTTAGLLPFYDSTKDDPVYYANVMSLMPYKELPEQCHYLVGSYV